MPGLPEIDLQALVQFLGYPGVFTVIFLESGVFFGFFLPGASLLFVTGMLASVGIFNIWILIPLLFTAAVLGDNVGYWFGTYVGRAIYKRPNSRFFKQEHVQFAHDFFEKYGRLAVLLARFVPIARTFTPILAGVGRMNYRIFIFYNVLGAITWACGVTLLGYLIGRHVPNAEHYLTLIILSIIGITTVPLFFTWWRQWTRKLKTEIAQVPCPRAIAFDLDNTLAPSFEPLPKDTARGLSTLMKRVPVAIISGASFARMEKYVLPKFPKNAHFENLYLFPDTAARCYRWRNGAWRQEYSHTLSSAELAAAHEALANGIKEAALADEGPIWGDRILARDSQITFAGVGAEAPADAKAAWDPDQSKRARLKAYLDEKLGVHDLDIRISSRTAIDITKKGINKALGVRWLSEHLNVPPKEMVFVGDDFAPEGNDAIVIPTGIQVREVVSTLETARIIHELVVACKAKE